MTLDTKPVALAIAPGVRPGEKDTEARRQRGAAAWASGSAAEDAVVRAYE